MDGWSLVYSTVYVHFLQHPEWVRNRDIRELLGHLERGNGKLALQDVHLLSLPVQILQSLGLPHFLALRSEASPTPLCDADEALISFGKFAKLYRIEVKQVFGIWIDPDATPIKILGMLSSLLGLHLTTTGRRSESEDPTQPRLYLYADPKDGREEVFAAWLARDLASDASVTHQLESHTESESFQLV